MEFFFASLSLELTCAVRAASYHAMMKEKLSRRRTQLSCSVSVLDKFDEIAILLCIMI